MLLYILGHFGNSEMAFKSISNGTELLLTAINGWRRLGLIMVGKRHNSFWRPGLQPAS